MSGPDLLLPMTVLLPLAGALTVASLGPRAAAGLALGTATLTLVLDVVLLAGVRADGFVVYRVGGWAPPVGIVLVADVLSATLATAAALIASASAVHVIAAREAAAGRRFYQPLFLVLLAAVHGAFYTGDLFNLYVFVELVILSSLPLVALAGRPVSAEVTFKYAVLAALGSATLLAGIGLVYASAGTLNLAHLAERVRVDGAPPLWPVAAAVVLVAFLLKAGIVPFHFWLPDAHSSAPTPVSAMLSGVLVKVGFYGVARTATLVFPEAPAMGVLAPLGALSALLGGLAALVSADLKRLLAYSTISNMGFMLLALGWGGPWGLAAALVNAVNHAVAKAALFLAGGYASDPLHEHAMDRLGGLVALTPGGALAFGLGAMALAGLPPLGGFVSKLVLLQAGLAARDWVLLTAAVTASAFGLAYAVRAFALVFWGPTPGWAVERWAESAGGRRRPLAPLALACAAIALGVYPGPLVDLAAAAAGQLLEPTRYVEAVLGVGR